MPVSMASPATQTPLCRSSVSYPGCAVQLSFSVASQVSMQAWHAHHTSNVCAAPSTLQMFTPSPTPLPGHPGKESQGTSVCPPWPLFLHLQCRAVRARTALAHLGALEVAQVARLPSCPVSSTLPTSDSGVQFRSHVPTQISRPPTPRVPQPPQICSSGFACMGPSALREPHGLGAQPRPG